jgi:hypothetical protein
MPAPLGQSVRNKANSSRAKGRASTLWKKSYDEFDTQKASAKQSQFPHGQEWARAGKTAECRRWDKSRETKPICAGSGEDQGPCDAKEEEVGRGRPTY